jgi:PilZ domain
MDELRKFTRVHVKADVKVTIRSAPGTNDLEGQTFQFRSIDASYEGMQLHLDIDIPTGSLLILEITFTDEPEKKYTNEGYVVWKIERTDDDEKKPSYTIGVQFNVYANPYYNDWTTAISRRLEVFNTQLEGAL